MNTPMNQDLVDFVTVQIPGTDTLPPAQEVIRYNEFVRLLFKADTEPMMGIHAALGLLGEAAELIEVINLDNFEHFRKPDQHIEELGDFEFYFQAIRNHYNLSRPSDIRLEHIGDRCFDLVVRSGRLCDLIKKEYIYRKPRETMLLVRYIDELDCTLLAVYQLFGVTRQEVLQANADKLSKRYRGLKYSDEAAIARADKAPGE